MQTLLLLTLTFIVLHHVANMLCQICSYPSRTARFSILSTIYCLCGAKSKCSDGYPQTDNVHCVSHSVRAPGNKDTKSFLKPQLTNKGAESYAAVCRRLSSKCVADVGRNADSDATDKSAPSLIPRRTNELIKRETLCGRREEKTPNGACAA